MAKNTNPMDEKELTPTPEEATLEQEALAEVKEDELREKLAGELGIEADNPLLDTLVTRELEHRQKLSKAVGQKIKYREAAKGVKPPQEKPKPEDGKTLTPEEIAAKVREEFEQRDLQELDYPEELKKEIAAVAKLKNISVRQAVKDPYIDYKIKAFETEKKSDDATVVRKDKGGKVVFDRNKPPKVDMSTEEGRKTWKEYTDFLRQPQ